MPGWRRPTRAYAPLLVRWGLGLLLLSVLVLRLGAGDMLALLGAVSWPLAAPALAGLVAVQAVAAAAWKMLSRRLAGITMSWAQALRAYYAAQAAGCLTPSNLGADAYRAYLLAAAHPWQKALMPIAVQRITSLVSLAMLGLLASLLLPLPPAVPLVLAGVAGLSLASVATLWALTLHGPASRSVRAWLLRHVRPLAELPRIGGAQWWRAVAGGAALSLTFHLASVGLSHLLILSLVGKAALLPALAALTLARLALLLPFAVSGLGFQEGAMVLLLPLAAVSSQAALAVSLLARLAFLAMVAVGTAFLATDHRGGR